MENLSLRFPKTLPQFIWHFIKPYSKYLWAIFVVIVLNAVNNNFLGPYMMKVILDAVETFKGEQGNQAGLWDVLLWPSILFAVLYQLLDLCWRLYDYLMLKIMPHIKKNVTARLFDYVSLHSYGFFQKNFAGSIGNKIGDMSRGIENITIIVMETVVLQITSLIMATASMYFVHPSFAILFVIWVIFFIAVVFWQSKTAHRLSQIFSESRSKAMGKIVDVVGNIMGVKLFSRRAFENNYLDSYLRDNLLKDQALQSYMTRMKLIQGVQVTVLLVFMLGLLIQLRIENKVTVGDFAFVLSVAINVIQGLWYLASHFVMFSQEVGTCNQALSLVSAPHEISDIANAKVLNISRGEILFDKVSFHYERGKNIFRDKTIKIEGGQKVGLVGFSGSGKTTFVNLVLRFFDIAAGKILIDGQDIAQVSQDSLRSQIAVIPQEPLLFHRSLIENIRYGKLDATDEEVMQASLRAHCHDFAEKLEHGYNTIVGERGIKLSGGQRQRIAIARAILKNSPILILDEATSALDSVTEKKIQESVSYVMQNRTSIVIAHRLSTLSDMDRVLVFHGGHVVEDGTHEELLKQPNGHYARLWQMQAGGFLPEKAGEEE
ncbi:MAG: ABC transporter ATP-binding protein [Gammaproteobacteria bacterium]